MGGNSSSHAEKRTEPQNGTRLQRRNTACINGNVWLDKRWTNVPALEEFEILRKLGEGGFGEVFLAKHNVDKQLFAIKALNKKHVVAHGQGMSVIIESEVMVAMSYPFVLRMHGAFQDEKYFYIQAAWRGSS
mmetsp:Transcript_56866/g.112989  ORF Transcript_56866/g.112989 Transcript_56866/m.112989 type:complete len:132 (+) Transcript_56866:147-542(+)